LRTQEQQTVLVLQAVYCEQTRQQLHAREKADTAPRTSEHLVGDGMPIWLTGSEFMERVRAQQDTRQRREELRVRRQVAMSEYFEALREWKVDNTRRLELNREMRRENAQAVLAWKTRKAKAVTAGIRFFFDRKPVRRAAEKALPRPQRPQVEAVSDEDKMRTRTRKKRKT
jgi:hypothetical protein